MNNTKEKQKGIVSIFITMMIMIVSLAMVLGLTVIFVGHLRIIRGMGDSVIAFHAANSGIERLLYEDKECRVTAPHCPVHCAPRPDCFGLATSTSFSTTLTNQAVYNAKFSVQEVGGISREQFESIGTFEGARRAISVSR